VLARRDCGGTANRMIVVQVAAGIANGRCATPIVNMAMSMRSAWIRCLAARIFEHDRQRNYR